MSANDLYPLMFAPVYMKRMWGGTMMTELLNREVPFNGVDPIGESWELVDREGEQSVVVNGIHAGKTMEELLKLFRSDILGPKGASCERFPLLVKLIDAGERLSLQVHPDAEACQKIGGDAQPKTEMWYILGCREDGCILAGLSSRATKLRLTESINSPEVENLLQKFPSEAGDGYFITSGTLHAIGGGNLILEIQQNSDTTYRISDWGRLDQHGNPRELHVEKGMMSINFSNRSGCRIAGDVNNTDYNRKIPMVKDCPFFRIEALHLANESQETTADSGSFHLLSSASGSFVIRCSTGEITIKLGETALLPYSIGNYTVTPVSNGDGKNILIRTTL
ncbi:MAG: class I mannose-6-phosphate isomerase [Lentisphaeria bacterium]|nr:class I mannose-6-phosphate isomerase [Lentisphaeria bacterium]